MNNISISLKNLLVFSLFIGVALSKLILPEGVNYTGSNTNIYSYISYLIEDFILLFCSYIYLKSYFNINHMNKVAFIYLLFYGYASIMFFYSDNTITSLHLALRGILYVFLGLLIFEYIKQDNTLKRFINMVHLFFIIGILSSVIETAKTISFEYVIYFGVGGSFYALFGMFSIYFQAISIKNLHFRSNKLETILKVLLLIVSILIVVKMNSLSSILCFFVAFFMALLLTKQFFKLIAYVVLLSMPLFFIYQQLETGKIKIAHKNLDTIMEGSGRVLTSSYCLEKIINLETDPFGTGFQRDGKILKNAHELEVTHTCHSSPISITVGLGYVGLLLYLAFVLILLKAVIYTYGPKELILFNKFALLSMILFGVGSPLYPGSPTLLISLTIIIFMLNCKYKSLRKINFE